MTDTKALNWWNSLSSTHRKEHIHTTWERQGYPQPIEKKARKQRQGIKLVDWGERRRMLSAFPGGFVCFDLCDASHNPVGISVSADMDTSRADILDEARREFIEMTGREPQKMTLRYSETHG